jgi:Zn-dependent protease
MAERVDPLAAVLTIALVILCLGVHEAAHAWTALKLGDPTGRDLGRVTLNPIPHIDPIMTIGIPVLCLLTGMPVFGGAKPVPVSFHRLRNPWFDMAVVSFAGPFSNFLLAILFYALAKFFVATGYYNGAAEFPFERWGDLLPNVLREVAKINVLLFVFNLIPIPPLDGSKVVAQGLPESVRESFLRIGAVGLLIIYGLISFVPAFGYFLWEAREKGMNVVRSIVTLGGQW